MIQEEGLRDLCRGLSGAIKSGLPLSSAFVTLSAAPAYGKYLARAAELTAGGASLHEAFSRQGVFPPVFTALLRAGEEGGKMDEFLDLYADSLDVRMDFRRQINRVLVYPAFTALVGLGLFVFLSLKAVPEITAPLAEAGAPAAPAAAAQLAAAGAALGRYWPAVLAGLAALWLAGGLLLRTGPFRKISALCCHWLPGFRYATAEARLYYVSNTIGLLLKAGFPLMAMMDVMRQFSQDDPLLSRRFSRAAGRLAGGGTFCRAMDGLFPPEDQRSMELAEGAGRLDETLLRLAGQHRDLHLHRLKNLVTCATITVTVALAPLCFILIISVLKPVFNGLGSAAGAAGQAGSGRSADMMSPEDAALAKAHANFKLVDSDTATTVFNATYGAAVMNFISHYATGASEGKAGPGTPPVKVGPVNESERDEPAAITLPAVPKPTPIPRLKKRTMSGPSAIAPTGIGTGK